MPDDLLLPTGWIARRSIGQANLRQRQSNTKMTNMENSDSMATAIISDTSPIPSNHCNGFRYLPILCSVIWLQFSHSPCFTAQLAIARAGCFSVVRCTAHARFGVHLQANPTSSVHLRGQCETNCMHGARIVTLLSCSQAERQFGSLAAFVRVDGAQQHAAGVVQVDNNTSLKIRKHRIPVRNGHVRELCSVDLNLHIYCRRTAVLDFYTVQLGTYSSDPRFKYQNLADQHRPSVWRCSRPCKFAVYNRPLVRAAKSAIADDHDALSSDHFPIAAIPICSDPTRQVRSRERQRVACRRRRH
ncbi:hypothetical protein Tsp_02699 [Trichinella spiralis]|uniref:hypothetical protein n=1 Tax=Trichinella spiralis TaxID=6334 RepID=UPI0001EFBF85|nr:hypothetical protein Tsp_02699 [Trichinella spiralis]